MSDQARELRPELARKIALFVGSEENRATDIPGLLIDRRICPDRSVLDDLRAERDRDRPRAEERGTRPNHFIYDASQYLLTSVDLPIVSRVVEASEEAPCLALSLKLEMPVIRELLSREEIQVAEAPVRQPCHGHRRDHGGVSRCLLPASWACWRHPADIPFLSGLIQREIIYRILRGPAGARLRAIATLGDQSHRTAKAIAWIRTNYAKPLRVEDLADIAGMGVSTLHHHFRALTAMSPLQYQKQIRLQAARGRMLVDGLDAASAAFEVGYESASQFNREYSRFFGQPPMRDVRALRSPSAPPLESPAKPA